MEKINRSSIAMENTYGVQRYRKRNTKIWLFTILVTAALTTLTPVKAAPSTLEEKNKNISSNENSFNNETHTPEFFHWEDYSVLAAMLIISCLLGIFYGYFGEKQTTSDDFLLGGSTMGTFPMALSLAASFVTAIELLGNPSEMYMSGAQFWMICVAFVLVVPIASHLFLPVFMRLRLTSCYEYLEVRFCKTVRVYACILYMLQMILYTAVAVYAPALALSDVTGLNTYLAVSLVYVVCVFYASQGGMKAVIMTDTFQSGVLIGSLAAVLALGAERLGGLTVAWDHARNTDRLHFFDMNPDPTVRHSFWSVVVGGTIYWTSMFCANQASIQKYLSVERLSQARIALWVSAIGLIAVYSVNFITGAVLAAYYADCDPIQTGEISASDRLLPLYVMNELGSARGIPGFFVAGIFAASLGTVASALNSLAALACQDLATGLMGLTIPEQKGAMVARWVCLACGAISFALVFLVERLGPVLQLALSFNGMAGGIALGLFSLGMLFPWANAKGAMVGGAAGFAVVVCAGGGAQFSNVQHPQLPAHTHGCHHPATNFTIPVPFDSEFYNNNVFWLFRVSYLWYSALGCAATLLVGLIVSAVTGVTDPADVPIDLMSPPVVKLLDALPDRLKKILRLPIRLGIQRRRSSSIRPPSLADSKDTRRRRRLSALAGGVFYSDHTPVVTPERDHITHDNLALDHDKPPPSDDHIQNTSV